MQLIWKGKKRKFAPPSGGFLSMDEVAQEVENGNEEAVLQSNRWREEGCTLAEEGHFQEAIGLWRKASMITPNDHRLHELKAQGYLALDQPMEAILCAEQAVELAPQWVDGLQSLARCQREVGEVALSLATYTTAHKLDPENTELAQEMAEVRRLVNQLEERRKIFLEKLKQSNTDEGAEVARCFYHLSARGALLHTTATS
eukprot:gene4948-5431_t